MKHTSANNSAAVSTTLFTVIVKSADVFNEPSDAVMVILYVAFVSKSNTSFALNVVPVRVKSAASAPLREKVKMSPLSSVALTVTDNRALACYYSIVMVNIYHTCYVHKII